MKRGPQDPFVEYLRKHAGDGLRGVWVYDWEDYRALHRRGDLTDAEEEGYMERAREEWIGTKAGKWDSVQGNLEAAVRVFPLVVLLNFPLTENRGVLVSIDADAAENLSSFVRDCYDWITLPEHPPAV